MRTICPLSQADLNSLRAERQGVIVQGLTFYQLPQRIIDRITKVGDCWRVAGWNTKNGFANIKVLGKTKKVHRVIYSLTRGPIPEGHVVDHKKTVGCRYRDCGRPGHLEPVLNAENTARGDAKLFTKQQGAEYV